MSKLDAITSHCMKAAGPRPSHSHRHIAVRCTVSPHQPRSNTRLGLTRYKIDIPLCPSACMFSSAMYFLFSFRCNPSLIHKGKRLKYKIYIIKANKDLPNTLALGSILWWNRDRQKFAFGFINDIVKKLPLIVKKTRKGDWEISYRFIRRRMKLLLLLLLLNMKRLERQYARTLQGHFTLLIKCVLMVREMCKRETS